MKSMKLVGVFCGALLIPISQSFCQTNLQFTGINATVENAIQISWASQSNHIYQIQCADSLIDTNTGSTTWKTLYDNYSSQGTNTFIGDFGNYDLTPAIPHPKYSPMRFYRIIDEATNTGENPTVAITSPVSSDLLSDVVTVSVNTSSSYPNITTELYVDGQKMDPTEDGTNYFINTCEWPNGPHTFFAIAKALSGYPGPSGHLGILVGRGVSPYVNVNFSNLISQIAFSQQFFQPSLGQTQEVTASFAANCNWTLQIQDVNTNTVRNASGSGTSLLFDWDGTGDGETNIPDGVYTYLISAEINGESSDDAMMSRGRFSSLSSSTFEDASELWARPTDSEDSPVPLALYPPGTDTNSLTIFSASLSEIRPLRAALSRTTSFTMEAATASYSGPSGQSSQAPTRPSTAPSKNQVGNYIIGYYNFTAGRDLNIPQNGITYPATGVVHLDGTSDSSEGFDEVNSDNEVSGAITAFRNHSWLLVTNKHDNALSTQEMRRSDQNYYGGEYFTQATIGIFLGHGSYGTDPDYSPGASGAKQTYFPSGNINDNGVDKYGNAWLRMCQFGFGGNLKWMVIDACNGLCDPNFSSMKSKGAIPLKTTHLLCSASTEVDQSDDIEANFVNLILSPTNTVSIPIQWGYAGREAYRGITNITDTVVFRTVGYPECMSDTVQNNTSPSSPSAAPGNLSKLDLQAYP
jgi:hypothetical protein